MQGRPDECTDSFCFFLNLFFLNFYFIFLKILILNLKEYGPAPIAQQLALQGRGRAWMERTRT